MAAVVLDKISLGFAKASGRLTLFDNFSLEIPEGVRRAAIVGADGAGKSTLLKLMVGLVAPQSGTVSLKEHQPAYMSQSLGLYEELSVIENLRLSAAINEAEMSEEGLLALLDKVDLKRFADRKAGALSGGMKQKLALCCTLAQTPKLFLLDEPTVGVDPLSRAEIWAFVEDYLHEQDAACIFSTAYLDEAARAELLLVLEEGRLMVQGRPQDLILKLKSRTFALTLDDPDERLKLTRALLCLMDDPKAPYVDAGPQLGRIELLAKEDLSAESFEAVLKEFLSRFALTFHFKTAAREPVLDDVLLSLNKTPEESAAFGAAAGLEIFKRWAAGLNEQEEWPIEAIGIKKCFKSFTAVENSDFKVRRAEIFALLGPNGAGKTTTFRMLCALLKPTSGKIAVLGRDLFHAKSQVRAQIGYVAQKFSLYRDLTLLQNLEYFGLSYGLSGSRLEARIKILAADFGLSPYFNDLASDLSFGIQRQLAMACALLHEPEILFLDEATSGADVRSRRLFWRRVNLLAMQGTTVVVTTHFMEEAEYCGRFLIQDRGRILALGTPDEICRDGEGRRISIEEAFISRVKAGREDL